MKKRLPESVVQFVNQQETIPVPPADKKYPYSDYVWKTAACILLSGRIKPKSVEDLPNLTDMNRLCKEANFNQYYLFSMASFLLAGEVIENDLDSCKKGKQFNAFWGDNLGKLQTVARTGFLRLIERYTPFHSWRPTLSLHSGMIEFLVLFFVSFEERALRYDRIGKLFLAFNKLPEIEGVLRIQACSAIVKPENPAMLSTIRNHSKLKGYIDPGGPPGYLLIKSRSNPVNFIRRCEELGFEVKPL